MILFALRCARGHQFESWFRDGDGFEAQQKAGEISCPECGETKVEKAVMAPRLGKPVARFRRLALGLGVAKTLMAGPRFRPKIAVDLAPLLATADAMPSATAALLKRSGAFSLRLRRLGPSRFQTARCSRLRKARLRCGG